MSFDKEGFPKSPQVPKRLIYRVVKPFDQVFFEPIYPKMY